MRVSGRAIAFPPASDGGRCKLRRVVRDADEDVTTIGAEIVDAIGGCNSLRIAAEVMVEDWGRGFPPHSAGVLEQPDELFLLGVHADDGVSPFEVRLFDRLNVLELLIPHAPHRG